MMRRSRVIFVLGWVLVGAGIARGAGPTTAQEVKPAVTDPAGLVGQLSDDRPEVRDAAQKALERLGDAAKPALASAAEEAGETGARARAVLDRLQMSRAERDVRVELFPRVQTLKKGDVARPVKVRLVNTGDQPVVLVRAGDTSEFQVQWHAKDDAGIEPQPPVVQVRSEAIERVKITDLITLKPGESIDVSADWRAESKQQLPSRFAFNRPGIYRVSLTYSFDPGEKLFYGPHPELVEAGLAPFKLNSEPVIIKVTE